MYRTEKSHMSHYFCATLQLHNSLVDCARDLFKPSKDTTMSLSLQWKEVILGSFVSDIISRIGYWPFSLRLPGLGPNCKREVFCSSFYWKLGWNFQPLISFLAFLFHKLRSKNNKLINCVIKGLINYFICYFKIILPSSLTLCIFIVNFHKSLQTYCVISSKVALKQVFMVFSREHCQIIVLQARKYDRPLSCVL